MKPSSAGGWVQFAWVPLAIAAHSTILNGQSGFAAASGGRKSFFSGFLWRSVGLSLLGIIPAVVVIIPVMSSRKEPLEIALAVGAYAVSETIILAKWGTMLPACVVDGDKSFRAAGARGSKVFSYVLTRLWGCNAVFLVAGFVSVIAIFSVIKVVLKHLNGSDQSQVLDFGLNASLLLLFAFNVVMLATILSRAYLVAEGKVSFEKALRQGNENAKSAPTISSSIITAIWSVKWIALPTFALLAVVFVFLHSDANLPYLTLSLAILPVPVSVAAASVTLKSSAPNSVFTFAAIKQIWIPFAWRSITLFIVGALPAAAIAYLVVSLQWPSLAIVASVLLCYAAAESVIIARLGTVLPACILGEDCSWQTALARGTRTFWVTLRNLWVWAGVATLITFLSISIIEIFATIVIKRIYGPDHKLQLESLIAAVNALPFIACAIASAVVSARMYLLAEFEETEKLPQ